MVTPPPIQLGTLSMADSLILMVLALVVFGPRKLPQIGRQIGKLMYEFRKASNDFKFQMEEELRLAEDADRRKKEEEERARNLALNPPAPSIEAQADIGATEQASVSAQPSPYPGEPEYPVSAGTEATEPAPPAEEGSAAEPAAEESYSRYPRIQPPATGEPVAAVRPGSVTEPEPATEPSVSAEADVGAEPPVTPAADTPATNSSTETLSHHG